MTQEEPLNISYWLGVIKFSPNLSKTEFMLIGAVGQKDHVTIRPEWGSHMNKIKVDVDFNIVAKGKKNIT